MWCVWNQICIIYKGTFLFLIIYYNRINKFNSELPVISFSVLIHKTTPAFWESVTILGSFGKSNIHMSTACNFDFETKSKGFWTNFLEFPDL